MEEAVISIIGIAALVFVVFIFLQSIKRKGVISNAYGADLTAQAAQGLLDPFDGREKEIDRVIHVLMRRTKNNPLLLGAPGVGKTAIVHGLAKRIIDEDVPKALVGKRVLALDLAAVMSDTKYRGELEQRLREILKTLEDAPRTTILFIDEIHILEQAKGTEGAVNISDILKPALSRGDLQIIGATTWDEYEEYIHPDAALDRRLQPVLVDEPTTKQTLRMLQSLRPAYEAFHGVRIPDKTLEAAITLSGKIVGRFLPDKAIDVIDEASAKVAIECPSHHHGKTLGVIHAAALSAKDTVTIDDVKSVVDQWTSRRKTQPRSKSR